VRVYAVSGQRLWLLRISNHRRLTHVSCTTTHVVQPQSAIANAHTAVLSLIALNPPATVVPPCIWLQLLYTCSCARLHPHPPMSSPHVSSPAYIIIADLPVIANARLPPHILICPVPRAVVQVREQKRWRRQGPSSLHGYAAASLPYSFWPACA